MIATFILEPPKSTNQLPTVHAVFQVGREGLKVKTHAYCPAQGNAADGTFQIPAWVFDGRPTYQPLGPQGATWHVCQHCAETLRRMQPR